MHYAKCLVALLDVVVAFVATLGGSYRIALFALIGAAACCWSYVLDLEDERDEQD